MRSKPKASLSTKQKCKYIVHSAIYSCELETKKKPTFDITQKAQSILDHPNNDGIIPINSASFLDPVPGVLKSFAIVVSINYPDGNVVTKFCTSIEGYILNIKETGTICNF